MTTAAEVKRLLGETCAIDPAAIRDDARLIEYGLDSVRATDLVIALEERFSISIPDTDAARLKTVADLQAYVARRTGGA